jgi:hypothetical protein
VRAFDVTIAESRSIAAERVAVIVGKSELFNVIRTGGIGLCAAFICVACEQSEPRSFEAFMEDGIARDGVLARCDSDPAASDEVECANARRAAAAVAAAVERMRSPELEQESERKLVALRDSADRQQHAEQLEQAEADAATKAEYEAQWVDPSGGRAFRYDVYAERTVPTIELAAVTPPSSDLEIPEPELDFGEVAIPRPVHESSPVHESNR